MVGNQRQPACWYEGGTHLQVAMVMDAQRQRRKTRFTADRQQYHYTAVPVRSDSRANGNDLLKPAKGRDTVDGGAGQEDVRQSPMTRCMVVTVATICDGGSDDDDALFR